MNEYSNNINSRRPSSRLNLIPLILRVKSIKWTSSFPSNIRKIPCLELGILQQNPILICQLWNWQETRYYKHIVKQGLRYFWSTFPIEVAVVLWRFPLFFGVQVKLTFAERVSNFNGKRFFLWMWFSKLWSTNQRFVDWLFFFSVFPE